MVVLFYLFCYFLEPKTFRPRLRTYFFYAVIAIVIGEEINGKMIREAISTIFYTRHASRRPMKIVEDRRGQYEVTARPVDDGKTHEWRLTFGISRWTFRRLNRT